MCFSGLFFYILLFLLDFFHIAPEGRAADAQLTGSGGAISAVGGDGLLDDIADDLFEGLLTGLAGRSRLRHGPQSPLFGEHIGHRPGPDVGAVRQGGEGAQDVLELGVIVGPGVLAEHLDGPGLEARELLAQLEVQAVEVEAGQRWDLVGAAAQGGQGKGQ